jgi:hypothetical protein
MRVRPSRLGRDRRGNTIVEFAVVLPVMMMAIMGLMELCFQVYVQSVLTGAVQKAGRDSTIETNISNTATIDAAVLATVRTVAAQASFPTPPTRQNFASFQQVNRVGPEPYVDSNKNGQYDKGECFDDINGNGVWDNQTTQDTGTAGTGGANDVVAYTVAIAYPRLFPISQLFGFGSSVRLTSTTMLRNQPFASQNKSETTICS